MLFESDVYLLLTDNFIKLHIFKKVDSEYNFEKVKEFIIEKKLPLNDDLSRDLDSNRSETSSFYENEIEKNDSIKQDLRDCYEKQIFTIVCTDDYIFLNNMNNSPIIKLLMKKLLKTDQNNISELNFCQKSIINFAFGYEYGFDDTKNFSFWPISVSKDGQYTVGVHINDLILYNWKNHSSIKFFNDITGIISSIYADFNRNLLITGYTLNKFVIRELFSNQILFYGQTEKTDDENEDIIDNISVFNDILILKSVEGKIYQVSLTDYSIHSDFPYLSDYVEGCQFYYQNNELYLFYTTSKIL